MNHYNNEIKNLGIEPRISCIPGCSSGANHYPFRLPPITDFFRSFCRNSSLFLQFKYTKNHWVDELSNKMKYHRIYSENFKEKSD